MLDSGKFTKLLRDRETNFYEEIIKKAYVDTISVIEYSFLRS